MPRKILIRGEGLTSLQLYVAVVTRFSPDNGNLECLNIAVLAEDTHVASVLIAQRHTDWDLQALTCLSDFSWFKFITLDSDCPQVAALRQFTIPNIVTIPLDEEEETYRR